MEKIPIFFDRQECALKLQRHFLFLLTNWVFFFKEKGTTARNFGYILSQKFTNCTILKKNLKRKEEAILPFRISIKRLEILYIHRQYLNFPNNDFS